MGKEQRSWRNYFKAAGRIKGYYFHILGIGIAVVSVLMAYSSRELNAVSAALGASECMESSIQLQSRLMVVMSIYFITFMVFVGCTIIYMIVLAQRVGGPIIAICAVIRDMKEGNYDVKRKLRDGDELQAIMTELKELAKQLKEKK